MNIDSALLKNKVFESIQSLFKNKPIVVDAETPLLGEAGIMDSLNLVELCLILEEMATDYGFEFDWTSETAMSRSRSMFRTAGTLAATFIEQSQNKT